MIQEESTAIFLGYTETCQTVLLVHIKEKSHKGCALSLSKHAAKNTPAVYG